MCDLSHLGFSFIISFSFSFFILYWQRPSRPNKYLMANSLKKYLSTENELRVRVLRRIQTDDDYTSIRELRHAGLKIDCFDRHGNKKSTPGVETPWTTHKPLSCPVTVLCNMLRWKSFSLVPTEEMCARKSQSHSLLSGSLMLYEVVCVKSYGERVLQRQACPTFSTNSTTSEWARKFLDLNIDRNLFEVQNGWFWFFSVGAFVQGVIPESEVRAYVFISKGCFNSVITISWLQLIFWPRWQCISSIEKSFFFNYTT